MSLVDQIFVPATLEKSWLSSIRKAVDIAKNKLILYTKRKIRRKHNTLHQEKLKYIKF